MQVTGKAQNLTPPHHAQTPYAGIIKIGRGDYVADPYTCEKVRHIHPGVSSPRMRDFARQIAHQKVLFFGFLQLATTKPPGRILTQNTQKLAVLRKDAFSGSRT